MLQNLKNLFKKEENRSQDPYNHPQYTYGEWRGYPHHFHNDPYKSGIVFSCVRILGNAIATNPLYIYRGNEIQRTHPLHSLLHIRSNEMDSPFELFWRMQAQKLLQGNGYLYIVRDEMDRVTELLPLPAQNVKAVKKEGMVVYEVGLEKENKVYLPSWDIVHIKGPTEDRDFLNGISVIKKYRSQFDIASLSENYAKAFYENGVGSTNLVTFGKNEKKVPPEVIKDTRRSIEERSGLANKFRTIFLNDAFDMKAIQMKLDDAEYLNVIKNAEATIASMYGVPLFMLNQQASAAYQNDTHKDLSFVKYSVRPQAQDLEKELTWKLLSPQEIEEGLEIRFDFSDILKVSPEEQSKTYKTYVEIGAMSINEVRERIGMTPVNNGDELLIAGEKTKLKDAGVKFQDNNAPQNRKTSLIDTTPLLKEQWRRWNFKLEQRIERIRQKDIPQESKEQKVMEEINKHKEHMKETGQALIESNLYKDGNFINRWSEMLDVVELLNDKKYLNRISQNIMEEQNGE